MSRTKSTPIKNRRGDISPPIIPAPHDKPLPLMTSKNEPHDNEAKKKDEEAEKMRLILEKLDAALEKISRPMNEDGQWEGSLPSSSSSSSSSLSFSATTPPMDNMDSDEHEGAASDGQSEDSSDDEEDSEELATSISVPGGRAHAGYRIVISKQAGWGVPGSKRRFRVELN